MLRDGGNIIVVNNIWQMMNVILVTFVGVVYHKCNLSILQGAGVLFAFASVLSLSCSDQS